MGWVESLPYFCAASKTARDVAVDYIKTTIGSLPKHKFKQWAGTNNAILDRAQPPGQLRYMLEVYMDDFISAIIPTSKQQIEHVARSILNRIHDFFPPSGDNEQDPILLKKLRKGNGTYDTTKCLLGFEFDRAKNTIWLEETKHAALLTILHQRIRGATKASRGILFAEFESVMAKLRHAFTALREGRRLLSPCNWVIRKQPQVIYLHQNGSLLEALCDISTILQASVKQPTLCKDLVTGWPDYIRPELLTPQVME
jgi:hypothetical protein